jgi:hypothetical protein
VKGLGKKEEILKQVQDDRVFIRKFIDQDDSFSLEHTAVKRKPNYNHY